MKRRPHVALLIEASHGYGRALLTGINQWLRECGSWSIYFRPQGLEAPPPKWLKEWHGDGILVRVEDKAMAEAVFLSGIPAVNLRLGFPEFPLPIIGMDNLALGGMAFEHLLNCGFDHFAFCGCPWSIYPWLDERMTSFQEAVVNSGRECHLFRSKARRKPSWEYEEDELAEWVSQLPRPVGVMSCTDDRGLELLEACRRADVLVPEEAAVIGVDNDQFVCMLSNPPMSSISPNAERIGYEAASLLNRMMNGEPPPKLPLLLPPGGVVARESTDILTTDDREIAKAIRLIREHACEGLNVHTLTRVTGLSYKNLERRIRAVLKRSPKEEILRVRIETARKLLLETSLPASAISNRCGFAEPKYFCHVFRQHVGMPPGAFRRTQIVTHQD